MLSFHYRHRLWGMMMIAKKQQRQQQTRIVPIEPELNRSRKQIITAIIFFITVFLLINSILQSIYLYSSSIYYYLLAFSAITLLLFGIRLLRRVRKQRTMWRHRDKKRRLAALHQLRKSLPTYTLPGLSASSPYAKVMPASLELRLQRSWFASGMAGLVIVHLMIWGIYGFWLFDLPGLRTINLGWFNIIFDIILFFTLSFYLVQWLINAPHQSLLATEDGLLSHCGSQSRYIPWHEVKLFAVIAGSDRTKNTLRYEVSSEHAIIRWTAVPFSSTELSMSTIGHSAFGLARPYPSQEAYFHRSQALLHFISKKTGLLLLYDLR